MDRLSVKKLMSQYMDARMGEIIQSDMLFFYSGFIVYEMIDKTNYICGVPLAACQILTISMIPFSCLIR